MREQPTQPLSTQIREQMRAYLFDNLTLKALAALIVTALWLSVGGQTHASQDEVMLHGLDVSLRNLPPNLIITGTDPIQVDVHVRGTKEQIRELRLAAALRASDLVPTADLATAQEGIYRFPLKLLGLPDGVTLINGVLGISPSSVRVILEPIRTREVTVEPHVVGQLPPGYKLGKVEVTPNTVTLSGAESRLRDIDRLQTTTVNLNGRTATFTENVDVDITDPDIVPVGPSRITLHAEIEEGISERTIEQIPVTVPGQANGAVSPATVDVTIRGPAPLLNALSSDDITVTIPTGEGPGYRVPLVAIDSPQASEIVVVRVRPATVRWKK